MLIDLNEPLDPAHHNRFSLAVDSGTLEHVFNFPVAMANFMKLVAPGGHAVMITPATGWLGHGFYQFSPDLFFRVFFAENGFRVDEMFLARADGGARQETRGCANFRSRRFRVDTPTRFRARPSFRFGSKSCP